MPADPSLLRRGALAFGVFPFAAQFPLDYLDDDGRRHGAATVDQFATQRGGRATTVLSRVKIRPLLLLHDSTRGENADLVGLRVNSVKPRHRNSPSWARISAHEHPLFFHLPRTARYGLPEESVISLIAVTAVNKNAILGTRGSLTAREMRAISERLARALSLDLGPLISAHAKELLRRAGLLRDR